MRMHIDKVETGRKMLAFTFDDGPDPVHTPELLELFRAYGAKATFFVIGSALERHPDIARTACDEGHELGNHTYSHPDLTKLGEDEMRTELAKTERLLADITGEATRTFRAPYLASDERVEAMCREVGYVMAGGVNSDTNDWAEPGVEHIVRSIRSHLGSGHIFVLHDGGGDRSQTVEAMRRLLPELAADGYELVTVSELLDSAAGAEPEANPGIGEGAGEK